MPKSLRGYADKEKARAYRNATRTKNYIRGDFGVNRHKQYTEEEKLLIKAHTMPDRELAEMLGRSVQAIQAQRCLLKEG